MTRGWGVYQLRRGQWEWCALNLLFEDALAFAIHKRSWSYRPTCITPTGIDPDVAYPEAAR